MVIAARSDNVNKNTSGTKITLIFSVPNGRNRWQNTLNFIVFFRIYHSSSDKALVKHGYSTAIVLLTQLSRKNIWQREMYKNSTIYVLKISTSSIVVACSWCLSCIDRFSGKPISAITTTGK
jgi:hypothetical protein